MYTRRFREASRRETDPPLTFRFLVFFFSISRSCLSDTYACDLYDMTSIRSNMILHIYKAERKEIMFS